MIEKIRERLDFNRKDRGDVKSYVLTGFLFCDSCGRSLSGQTQKMKSGRHHQYYQHATTGDCGAFHSIRLKPIEDAVLRTIFENVEDRPAFERAIAESLPDEKLIQTLKGNVSQGEKTLKRLDKDLDKLVDLALSGTLAKETIRKKEESLLTVKSRVAKDLEEAQSQLRTMPDMNFVKKQAEAIRRQLLKQYGSEERLQAMSFDDKKALLHWLFDGKDKQGKKYGIYVTKRGKGPDAQVDYFMYGRIVGLRTLKGDDINYQDWDGELHGLYKTDKITRNRTGLQPWNSQNSFQQYLCRL